jgi:hypothetical protein
MRLTRVLAAVEAAAGEGIAGGGHYVAGLTAAQHRTGAEREHLSNALVLLRRLLD